MPDEFTNSLRQAQPDLQAMPVSETLAHVAASLRDAESATATLLEFVSPTTTPQLIALTSQFVPTKHVILPVIDFSTAARKVDLLLTCLKLPAPVSLLQATPPASASVDDTAIVDSDDMIFAAIDRAFDLFGSDHQGT